MFTSIAPTNVDPILASNVNGDQRKDGKTLKIFFPSYLLQYFSFTNHSFDSFVEPESEMFMVRAHVTKKQWNFTTWTKQTLVAFSLGWLPSKCLLPLVKDQCRCFILGSLPTKPGIAWPMVSLAQAWNLELNHWIGILLGFVSLKHWISGAKIKCMKWKMVCNWTYPGGLWSAGGGRDSQWSVLVTGTWVFLIQWWRILKYSFACGEHPHNRWLLSGNCPKSTRIKKHLQTEELLTHYTNCPRSFNILGLRNRRVSTHKLFTDFVKKKLNSLPWPNIGFNLYGKFLWGARLRYNYFT